jgi:hypothetical protein
MAASETPSTTAGQELRETDFAGIHLRAGETLIVQPLSGFEAEPFSVSYIGAHGKLSFLTSLPRVGEKGKWVTPGNPFKFRVVHGKYVYAFTARSLRAHSRPYPYAHFSVPESVKYRQVRQSHRLETRLPVEIRRGDGSHAQAVMRDISEHGARLEMTEALGELAEVVTLTLPIMLPHVVRSIVVTATLCNCGDTDRSASTGRFDYGVSFSLSSEDDQVVLQHFIDHSLVEQLA